MPSILITGVSSGIGRATAERFARAGWDVIGTVRDLTAAQRDEWPGRISLRNLDLSDPDGIERFSRELLAEGGPPDVLLNNAGAVQFDPIEEVESERVRAIYQVNLFGPLALIVAFLPAMRERGSGTIANVTSLGGRLVFPFFAVYNSSKHAFEGISEGLWHELKPFGIRVKAIEPGFVETAIWEKVHDADRERASVEPGPYGQYLSAMASFEAKISKRSTPEESAEEIYAAVTDDSDRLRYPVSAYASTLIRARRIFGDQAFMRFFHSRWMGRHS